MNTTQALLQELDAPFSLSKEQVDFFRENKFIKFKQVFSPAVLAHYEKAISQKVQEFNTVSIPMEKSVSIRDGSFTELALTKRIGFVK